MSYARLTLLSAATAIVVMVGCAGPAWLIYGESPTAGRRAIVETESSTTSGREVRRDAADTTTPDEQRSLPQAPDDPDTAKAQNPTDLAAIQRSIEDAAQNLPAHCQQTFKDQMLTIALQQLQPTVASSAAAVQPGGPIGESPAPVQPAATGASATQQSPAFNSSLAVTPTLHSSSAGAAPTPPAAAPSQAATGQITDKSAASATTTATPATGAQAAAATKAPASESAHVNDPGPWDQAVQQALAALNRDLTQPTLDQGEKARLEIMRRLLYVATNQRDKAVSPIEQLDEEEREYWKHQIHGLLVSIDADGKHPTTRRAALALRNLRTATDHLANVSTLDVRNLTFCKEVLSYGEYRVFDSYSFRAKDEVVMYVEIDNFAAHPKGDRFETELHSSYEIVDDAGRRVANVVLPIDKQVSNNRRRDYFIAYLITMPSQIAPGSYRLRLTVEDVIGKKSNHATVDFRIQ